MSETIAVAEVVIGVNQTKFARALNKARTYFQRWVKRVKYMATAGRPLAGIAKAAGALAKKFIGLAKSVARLVGPWAALLGGGSIAAIFIGSAVKFAQFEQGMARVLAVTNASQVEFSRLKLLARDLGATTAFTATQAAEAMGNFGVAGFKTGEIMAAMKPTLNLASAGQLDMATASDIVAKTMRGMGLDATETAHAVDVMAKAFTTSNTDLQMLGDAFKYVGPVGKAAGKSLEELTASIQVMSNAGIQGGQAGAALRNILLRLQSQPTEVKKALEALGVTIEDSMGRMKPLAQIVDEVGAAMADKTEMEKSSIAMTLAGTRATAAFLELLNAGGDTLRTYQKRLEGAAGTAKRIAEVQLNTLQGSFTLLKSAVEGAAIQIGEQMAPGIRMVADALQLMMPTIGSILSGVKSVADTLGATLASKILAMNEMLKQTAGTFKQIFEWLSVLISNPLGGLKVAGLYLGSIGLDWGAAILESGNKFVASFGQMVGETLYRAWEGLKDILLGSWDVLKAVMEWAATKIQIAIADAIPGGATGEMYAPALKSQESTVKNYVKILEKKGGQGVGSFVGGLAALSMGDPAEARKQAADMRQVASNEMKALQAERDASNAAAKRRLEQEKKRRTMRDAVADPAARRKMLSSGGRAAMSMMPGGGLLSMLLNPAMQGAAAKADAATGGLVSGTVAAMAGGGEGARKAVQAVAKGKGGGNMSDVGGFMAAIQRAVLGKEKAEAKRTADATDETRKLTKTKTVPLLDRIATGVEALAGGTASAVFAPEGAGS